jgi:hypothetical protein
VSQPKPHYVRITPGEQLPDISNHAPFKAVVIIATEYEPEWQREVSRWLVGSGCLYMMAWGPDCSSWDDSVDHANISDFAPDDIPDDKFVMTTWHDKESLENVFWFAQFCAQNSYDDGSLKRTLIIHVSREDARAWMEQLFDRSYTLAEREEDSS